MPCYAGQALSHLRREVRHCRNVSVRPKPPHKVTCVPHTPRRCEADSQVKGLPSDGTCLLGLVLRGVSGGEQGQVEGSAAHVTAVHIQGAPRVTRGVTRLAKITEALRHAGRQVRLIEIPEPRRVILAGRAVEGPLSRSKSRTAGVSIVTGGMPVRFHHEALGQQCGRAVPDSSGLGCPGKVDGLIRTGQVESLVCLGSQNLRSQSRVTGMTRVGQCLRQVPLGDTVLVAVVSHPPG